MKKFSKILALLLPLAAVAATNQITSRQVTDNSLLTSDLKTTNAAVDEGVLTYEASDNSIQYQVIDDSVTLDDAYNNAASGNKLIVADDGTVTIQASGTSAGLEITQSGSASYLRAGTFRIRSDNAVVMDSDSRFYTDNGTDTYLTQLADNALTVVAGSSASFQVNQSGVKIGGFETMKAYDEIACVPTYTLVGGAGNVVPQYVTNFCQAFQIGSLMFVDIYLDGDAGNDGAGTGSANIALPQAAAATHPTDFFPCGNDTNLTVDTGLWCQISGGATTVEIATSGETPRTGANQSGTTRNIRLKFFYFLTL